MTEQWIAIAARVRFTGRYYCSGNCSYLSRAIGSSADWRAPKAWCNLFGRLRRAKNMRVLRHERCRAADVYSGDEIEKLNKCLERKK